MIGVGLTCGPVLAAATPAEQPRFRIGACDWSLGKRGSVEALSVAAGLGLDGVQVSFGPSGGENDLREERVRARYEKAIETTGVEIASLAMGVLNQVPLATSDEALRWVAECIEVMPKLNQKVVLLAFFGKGDIHGKPDAQDAVIARLKQLAPAAEAADVELGIESYMDADEHLRILEAVDSPAVRVYYDVANMTNQGYDICQEIRRLGLERICEIHCKENGHLLGAGRVDFPQVKEALDDIDWSGWLILESAVPKGMAVAEAYPRNARYLREVFLPS